MSRQSHPRPLLATLPVVMHWRSLTAPKALTSEYIVESVFDVVAPSNVCGVGEALCLPA